MFSCSKSEEIIPTVTPPAQFFNLNIGSKWVYKKYHNSSLNPTQFTFTGIVDTVKIVSIENIQGFNFAKKSSKKVNLNNGYIAPIEYSFQRINNLGHLIEISDINSVGIISETTGIVVHPINDFSYFYNYDFNGMVGDVFGTITYHLYNPINSTVEGVNYTLLPYKGIFTPSTSHPELISKTVEYNYSENIGLVKNVCHSMNGNYIYEERLVSYQLN